MSPKYSSAVRKMFRCVVISVLIITAVGTQQDVLSASNAKFALDLYKRQAVSHKGRNIFMSPFSISVALAMTHLGARGQTKSQMSKVLRFSDVEEDHLHQTFAEIQSVLNRPGQACKLYMANRLFGRKSYKFLPKFLDAGQLYYGAELKPVDFR